MGWAGLVAVAPKPVTAFDSTGQLAQLEQAFATDPDDVATAQALAATYIDLRRPALAIALIRSVKPELLEDPLLSHQLARAYESTERVAAALGTANLALARCARAMGSSDVLHVTQVPSQPCSERALASLERHRNALAHMQQWGVQSARDPRIALAYRLAERRVSLAAFSTP